MKLKIKYKKMSVTIEHPFDKRPSLEDLVYEVMGPAAAAMGYEFEEVEELLNPNVRADELAEKQIKIEDLEEELDFWAGLVISSNEPRADLLERAKNWKNMRAEEAKQ